MNTDVVPYLRCPVCGGELAAAGGPAPAPATAAGPRQAAAARALRCPRGHTFDIARQGYVHLAAGPVRHAGDSAPMVAAREEFLAAGHYDFLSAALADAALTEAALAEAARAGAGVDHGPAGGLVVDAGAGTGRHLSAVLDVLPAAVGLALDVSKPALRRAARAHPRAAAALCDTWGRLPVADGAAAVLLDVFAPRHGAEFHRVLRPGGLLVVVTPEPGHLAELVGALGLLRVDPEKPARVAASLGAGFAPAGETVHRRVLRLSRRHVRTLVEMGPSAWHAAPDELAARVAAMPGEMTVTALIRLRRYRTRAVPS